MTETILTLTPYGVVFSGYQETMETIIVSSLILFLIVTRLTIEVMTSNFEAVTSSTGEKLCSVAKPSDTVMNVRSDIQCGTICMSDKFCETYSYKKELKECDLYDCTVPQNYSAVLGCSSYKLQGKFSLITVYHAMLRGVYIDFVTVISMFILTLLHIKLQLILPLAKELSY